MATYPISDHCDGERFFNPHAKARPLRDVIKWMRTRERTPWPKRLPLAPHPPPPSTVGHGEVAVTFIGHSTFLIRTASAVILTDPVFTPHAGPFGRMGPPRVRPPAIAPRRCRRSTWSSSAITTTTICSLLHCASSRIAATFVAPLGVALS